MTHAGSKFLSVCAFFFCGDQGVGFKASGWRFRVSALPVLLCNPKPDTLSRLKRSWAFNDPMGSGDVELGAFLKGPQTGQYPLIP